MSNGLLIDDKGRSWADNSREIAKRISYRDARIDLATYAVRERGFIHIRPQGGSVRVTVRERRFSLVSFAGAMLELGRMKFSRIVLCVMTDGEADFRVFADIHDFCSHLEALARGKPLEIRIPRLSEPRNPKVLTLPPFAKVQPIIELWKQTRGELTDEVHKAVKTSGLMQRMILVRQPAQSTRLITEHLGSGIMVLRPCESLLMTGREFGEHPDGEYGAWVVEAYATTAWHRRLRVESVRALIRTSATTTLRTRYDRVLMPWRSAGKDLLIMGVSVQRDVPTAVS